MYKIYKIHKYRRHGMGFNLGIGNYLEYKHDEGTAIYSVGDNVVCEAEKKGILAKLLQ